MKAERAGRELIMPCGTIGDLWRPLVHNRDTFRTMVLLKSPVKVNMPWWLY